MQLKMESGVVHENPNAEKIAGVLASLDGNPESFAILSKTDLTYLQVSASSSRQFALEYQDGSIDKHYSSPLSLSLGEVIKLFQSYANGDDWWLTAGKWETMSLKAGKFRFSLGKIQWSKRIWRYVLPFGGCAIAVIFGHGKKDGEFRFWFCLFWISMACFFLFGQLEILKKGYYGRRFRTVTRAKSPIEFYITLVVGFSVVVAILVVAILVALGRIAQDP